VTRRCILRSARGLAVATALAPLAPLAGSAQESMPLVRVGAGLDVESTPLIYAVKAGMFAAAGLNVQVVKLNGGGAAIAAAVVSGALEFGKASLVSVIVAHARNVPLVLIAPAAGYSADDPDIPLMVAANSPIKDARDLAASDNAVGVASIATTGMLATRVWVDANGGDSSKIRFVELSPTATAAAIDQGRIAASPLTEPALSAAMSTGRFRILSYPYNAIARRYELADWFANPNWIAQHRDVAEKFAQVMAKANAYVAAHEAETRPLIADYLGIDPAVLAKMKNPERSAALQAPLIQPVIDACVKYKLIPSGFPAAELISDAALKPVK
jgi:NitT/TauT family transport system substrate-binding protein